MGKKSLSLETVLWHMRVDLGSRCNNTNSTGPQTTCLEPLDESIHRVNYFQIIWGFFALTVKIIGKLLHLDLEDVLSLFSVFSKKIIKNGWKDMILAFPSCVPGSCSLPFPLTGWEWAVFPLRPLKRAAWKQSQAGHSCRFIVAAWLIDLLMNRRKKKKAFNVRVS